MWFVNLSEAISFNSLIKGSLIIRNKKNENSFDGLYQPFGQPKNTLLKKNLTIG